MRLLLDTCVWGGAAKTLRLQGHDVVWTGEWGHDPGDGEILKYAIEEARTLVTLDKDFGELAVVHGIQHHGIIRVVGFPARQIGNVIMAVLGRYAGELAAGALLTVEPGRVRIRISGKEPE